MQIVVIPNSGINISCVLCGTKNVTTTLNGEDVSDQENIDGVEIKFTECHHFEGTWTNEGVEVDKNRIIQEAYDKTKEIENQIMELFNTKSEQLEKKSTEEFEKKSEEISKAERDEYFKKESMILKECYAEIGWPQDVPIKRIRGFGMVGVEEILKKQLDDTYVMFEYNSGPWSIDGYYLYHFDTDEE